MTKSTIASAALLALLLAAACATAPPPRAVAIFSIADPAGDDHGNGALTLPMSGEINKGELDLTSLQAFPTEGGTTFEATFTRKVHTPTRRMVDIGVSLDQIARHGFYTFNLDIYVDQDGVADSGNISTLPGRNVIVDPRHGWEKAIILTPDPLLARSELKRLLLRAEADKRTRSERGNFTDEMKEKLRGDVDAFVFFPTRIEVAGNKVSFFVPSVFLGGPAKADWGYAIAVSGAALIDRSTEQGRGPRAGRSAPPRMILPIEPGRPENRFGGGEDDDLWPAPLVDIVVPAGTTQEQVLSRSGDKLQPAVLPVVVPATQ